MPEQPRYADSLHLVALSTAVPVARLFVAATLRRWKARFIAPDMESIAGALVAISVTHTGPTEGTSWTDITELRSIKLRLLGYAKNLVLEVIDEHGEALVIPEATELPEDSGLGLIDARAGRWGSYLTPRGRLTWAELAVFECTAAGLPVRTRRPLPWRSSTPTLARDDADLLRRVRDGLEHL